MVRLPAAIDGQENIALSSGATSVPYGEYLIAARLPSHEYADPYRIGTPPFRKTPYPSRAKNCWSVGVKSCLLDAVYCRVWGTQASIRRIGQRGLKCPADGLGDSLYVSQSFAGGHDIGQEPFAVDRVRCCRLAAGEEGERAPAAMRCIGDHPPAAGAAPTRAHRRKP